MKSYGVTIQVKPLQQYFHMVLFVLYVVLSRSSSSSLSSSSSSRYMNPMVFNETSSAAPYYLF